MSKITKKPFDGNVSEIINVVNTLHELAKKDRAFNLDYLQAAGKQGLGISVSDSQHVIANYHKYKDTLNQWTKVLFETLDANLLDCGIQPASYSNIQEVNKPIVYPSQKGKTAKNTKKDKTKKTPFKNLDMSHPIMKLEYTAHVKDVITKFANAKSTGKPIEGEVTDKDRITATQTGSIICEPREILVDGKKEVKWFKRHAAGIEQAIFALKKYADSKKIDRSNTSDREMKMMVKALTHRWILEDEAMKKRTMQNKFNKLNLPIGLTVEGNKAPGILKLKDKVEIDGQFNFELLTGKPNDKLTSTDLVQIEAIRRTASGDFQGAVDFVKTAFRKTKGFNPDFAAMFVNQLMASNPYSLLKNLVLELMLEGYSKEEPSRDKNYRGHLAHLDLMIQPIRLFSKHKTDKTTEVDGKDVPVYTFWSQSKINSFINNIIADARIKGIIPPKSEYIPLEEVLEGKKQTPIVADLSGSILSRGSNNPDKQVQEEKKETNDVPPAKEEPTESDTDKKETIAPIETEKPAEKPAEESKEEKKETTESDTKKKDEETTTPSTTKTSTEGTDDAGAETETDTTKTDSGSDATPLKEEAKTADDKDESKDSDQHVLNLLSSGTKDKKNFVLVDKSGSGFTVKYKVNTKVSMDEAVNNQFKKYLKAVKAGNGKAPKGFEKADENTKFKIVYVESKAS